MTEIHPLACVDKNAELGENVKVEPFALIESGAVLGDGCSVGSNALVTSFARIGEEVKIHNGAVVGTQPQDLKFGGEDTVLEVGDRTVIREFASLNRGTVAYGKTTIGSDCLIMAYAHIAHDCIIGNHVILANSVNMGGHVVIGDFAIVGGMVPIHQFVRIGAHSMIGGGFRVPSDIPPFVTAAGDPLGYKGVNSIGLKRRGYKPETIKALHGAYKLIYRSGLNISQAIEKVKEEIEQIPEVIVIIDFFESRENRGIMK
ncbi:MAG: acyl-ACP--UDP-N-acetylglucosamine O-acyltransferase [Candidatus Electryonea clarkiae]|nr:acyl-ACP--UDP-N-acetylglucosamine O-acyltransferase [Candidatus Electryonea clarkiae]MDP8287939.1 acyl-ACP--UDP-N-acetylglucosamine O-acyltransferase [Candidatus Electryonea clarkiae]